MTVQQLIEELKKYNGESPVWFGEIVSNDIVSMTVIEKVVDRDGEVYIAVDWGAEGLS